MKYDLIIRSNNSLKSVTVYTYINTHINVLPINVLLYQYKRIKVRPKQENKTKKEHNMVQSTIHQKCGNEGWSLLFKIIR